MASMKMWRLFFLCLFCGYSDALTDIEAKLKFVNTLMACTQDHPVEFSEISNLQKFVVPKDPATKCLLACTYRKIGTMDSKGMFDLENGYKVAEKMREGDDKRVVNGKKLADTCVSVNKETVSDGEKGCERAALIFKCVAENAPKLGFEIN